MNLGSAEVLIVVALLVLVFGAGWLPKAARNLGRAKVELDKTQAQLNTAKQSVIESTGIEGASNSLRKANNALRKSPQQLMKDAVRSSGAAAMSPDLGTNDDTGDFAVDVTTSPSDEDPSAS